MLTDAQDVLGNGRFALIVVPSLILLMIAGGGWVGWVPVLIIALTWIAINMLWNTRTTSDTNAPWFKQKAKIGNGPFVLYLLILTGFWASFNQIFITMPEYIRDFVETSDLVQLSSVFGQGFVNFIANVNVESLASTIGELAQKHGMVEGTEEVKQIFFQLVHLKVRVPEDVIIQTFNNLAATGAPSTATLMGIAEQWLIAIVR